MKPTALILFLTVAAVATLSHCTTPNTETAPPNIIFILADDMGYGDVAALNPDSKIPTPHLDRLVQEGMYFSDALYGSSPGISLSAVL